MICFMIYLVYYTKTQNFWNFLKILYFYNSILNVLYVIPNVRFSVNFEIFREFSNFPKFWLFWKFSKFCCCDHSKLTMHLIQNFLPFCSFTFFSKISSYLYFCGHVIDLKPYCWWKFKLNFFLSYFIWKEELYKISI